MNMYQKAHEMHSRQVIVLGKVTQNYRKLATTATSTHWALLGWINHKAKGVIHQLPVLSVVL